MEVNKEEQPRKKMTVWKSSLLFTELIIIIIIITWMKQHLGHIEAARPKWC